MITREPDFLDVPDSLLGQLGRSALITFQSIGQGMLITLKALRYAPFAFGGRSRVQTFQQMFTMSIKTLPVLTIVAIFTGMIFCLQTGIELKRFGQEAQVGSAVTVVMFREMGPFMTALIIAASVGSAIAAQIGTMTVSEEVAALEIMSIDPVRFLVMPRLVAFIICMPALTFYVDIMAILGGGIVAYTQLDVTPYQFWDNATWIADNKDLFVSQFKSIVFGIIINAVACLQGFRTRSGAVGVGIATRKTVVISFLTILIVGFIITKIFYA